MHPFPTQIKKHMYRPTHLRLDQCVGICGINGKAQENAPLKCGRASGARNQSTQSARFVPEACQSTRYWLQISNMSDQFDLVSIHIPSLSPRPCGCQAPASLKWILTCLSCDVENSVKSPSGWVVRLCSSGGALGCAVVKHSTSERRR